MFKNIEELNAFWKQKRAKEEAEKKLNDPYSIKRFEPDSYAGAVWMEEKALGEYVKYEDYIDKIERLKAIHRKELENAYSSGRNDGVQSTIPSWRD